MKICKGCCVLTQEKLTRCPYCGKELIPIPSYVTRFLSSSALKKKKGGRKKPKEKD